MERLVKDQILLDISQNEFDDFRNQRRGVGRLEEEEG
jgi:hypothetical protein